jgi:two-component system sensor histidine kinase PilS (NtrC family)
MRAEAAGAGEARPAGALPVVSGPTPAPLHRKLVWLTFFRVVMVTVLLGGTAAMSWSAPEPGGGAAALYALVGATYAATLALAAALRTRFAPRAVAYAQVALDAAIAGAVVRLTGGAESVFVFLFSLGIVNGSILLFRRGALVAAALAVGTYVVAVTAGLPQESWPRWQTLFAHGAAFALTAALAGYLAEQLRDTGERLAAREVDLAAVTAIHEALVQSVSSGLLTVDPAGRITFLNRAAEQLTGLRLEDVRGGAVDRWFGAFQEVVAHEEMSLRKEMDFVDARGAQRRVGYLAFPLRGREEVIGHAVIFQDLTAMRAMEDAVRRSERLADLGRLAAGLAHELRNPLASISGSVELLERRAQLDDADRRLMAIVLRETGRLEDLVRRFLQFTRPPEPACRPTDLASVVGETLDVFANDRGGAVRLERALDPVVVACDGDQVKQVLWNLVTNAAQAIGAVEELPTPSDPLARARGLIRVSCGPDPGGGARLVVADDGPGISAPDLLRVFTPFFTTKRAGTGLGLATVHRIVEAHGGSVTVDSREGHGATFVVRLPGARRAAASSG